MSIVLLSVNYSVLQSRPFRKSLVGKIGVGQDSDLSPSVNQVQSILNHRFGDSFDPSSFHPYHGHLKKSGINPLDLNGYQSNPRKFTGRRDPKNLTGLCN